LPWGLYPVILTVVKTAISIPDETFERIERSVADLGISRSEFFVRAAKKYLAELAAESITAQIDAALDACAGDEHLVRDVTEHGRRSLLAVTADDEW
jgi:metal-responsive CopG/Arc/MetJ family transcriptional regulator